jgi:hypothetical protein
MYFWRSVWFHEVPVCSKTSFRPTSTVVMLDRPDEHAAELSDFTLPYDTRSCKNLRLSLLARRANSDTPVSTVV